jgi:hypothetical protein
LASWSITDIKALHRTTARDNVLRLEISQNKDIISAKMLYGG